MEFKIDICNSVQGDLTVLDLSKEYDQYLSEEKEAASTYEDTLLFKYSKSVTVNVLMKIGTTEITFLDALIHEHNQLENGVYKDKINRVYIIDEGVIKKEVEGVLKETTLREVLEMNLEGTPIQQEHINTFFTGNMQQCYINYCKRLFDALLNKCRTSAYNEDLYARDFIWMTLNIIDYLIQFEQFMEAEKIVEEFNTCGGFCQNNEYGQHTAHGCGCSKA